MVPTDPWKRLTLISNVRLHDGRNCWTEPVNLLVEQSYWRMKGYLKKKKKRKKERKKKKRNIEPGVDQSSQGQ